MNDYTYDGTILKIENLSLSYGDNKIITNLSHEIKNITRPNTDIQQGQVIALLGPSGCGKSQLFSLLARLNEPDSGTIILGNGEHIERGEFGLVDQHYTLLDDRTVMQNIDLAIKKSGLPKNEGIEKAHNLLKTFNIFAKKDSYPQNISGGQRQRVAIIVQLISSKFFLLMDEPFSGLDPRNKKEARNLILEVSQLHELNTLIISTHDLYSAVQIADTIIIMGQTYDANGKELGSKIMHEFNLIERGLAWQNNIEKLPQFMPFIDEMKAIFDTLEN